MENFDKKLRQLLESPPHFEPTEVELESMRQAIKNQNSTSVLRWIPIFLFVPFLFGGAWAFGEINGLRHEVGLLKAHQTPLNVEQNEKITTVEKTVYVIDTIYRTVYATRTADLPNLQGLVNLGADDGGSLPNAESFVSQSATDGTGLLNLEGLVNQGEQGNQTTEEDYFDRQRRLFEAEKRKALDFLPSPEWNGVVLQNHENKPEARPNVGASTPTTDRINPLLYTLPQGFSMGIAGSPLAATPMAGNGNLFAAELGISADLQFVRGLRLESGLFLTNSKVYASDDGFIGRFPEIMGTDPADNIKELKGNLTALRIPFIFTKTFKQRGRFSPVFGLGFAAQRPLWQRMNYEFVDGTGDEYYINQNYSNGSFSFGNPYISLGVRRAFLKNYDVAVHGFYQNNTQVGAETVVPPHYFGLRLGIEKSFF